MAVAQKTPTTYWYEGNIINDFILTWIKNIANSAKPCISYGTTESDIITSYKGSLSGASSYVATFDTVAIKLGLQGGYNIGLLR
jgi:hypothetical protein